MQCFLAKLCWFDKSFLNTLDNYIIIKINLMVKRRLFKILGTCGKYLDKEVCLYIGSYSI